MFFSLFLEGCYVTKLAIKQNNLFNSRRKITDIIEDQTTDDKLRKKLIFLQDVLQFASEQGLNAKGAYSYYIDVPGNIISHLVYAAEADQLKPVKWWFPVVGRVPYRGYFEKSERDEKATALKEEGYDVYTTEASAYSSLGWFEDPIYSSMLRRRKESLAHLIFHELTHRTFWYPGSVKFNENLAEYVAEIVTIRFFQKRNGQKIIERYLQVKADRDLYKKWLKDLKGELEDFYKKNQNKKRDVLLSEKSTLYQSFLNDKKPEFKRYDFIGKSDWNNARVLAASLYAPETDRFKKAHKCLKDSSIALFFSALKKASKKFDKQFQALDSLCQIQTSQVSNRGL